MAIVYVKTVHDRNVKGVIVTAETLLDLRRVIKETENPDIKRGMESIVNTLEDFYNKIGGRRW